MARATAQNTTKTTLRIADLSFVTSLTGKLQPGQSRRCFWNVKATGDYDRDFRIGERLDLEYLAYEEANLREGGPGSLQHIVGDMPRPLTGVEVGFLIMVSYAAGSGAHESRRVSAFWQSARDRGYADAY